MPKEDKYHHASHSKYLLKYHFVFACKYRNKLLGKQNIADEIKSLFTDMVEFQPVYVGKPSAVVGVIGEFYGPSGRTEREDQDRLLDYLQSDVGMKHFKDVYPDTDEAKYQEVLFQLYEMDEKETFRNS